MRQPVVGGERADGATPMKIFVVNSGSSSIKYQLVDVDTERSHS
jgi:hypothetical protein